MTILQDGTILYRLLEKVKPHLNVDQKQMETHKLSTATKKKILQKNLSSGTIFGMMERISAFLNWCKLIGVRECELFQPLDLVEFKNINLVLDCLLSVQDILHKRGIIKYFINNQTTTSQPPQLSTNCITSVNDTHKTPIVQINNSPINFESLSVETSNNDTSQERKSSLSSGYVSRTSNTTSNTETEDDDDVFKGIKDLEGELTIPTKTFKPIPKVEDGEPWDLDLDLSQRFLGDITTRFSYYANKTSEINQVRQQAEEWHQQLNYLYNPTMVMSLFSILKVKQEQIGRAYHRKKINHNDYQDLQTQLNDVKILIVKTSHHNTNLDLYQTDVSEQALTRIHQANINVNSLKKEDKKQNENDRITPALGHYATLNPHVRQRFDYKNHEMKFMRQLVNIYLSHLKTTLLETCKNQPNLYRWLEKELDRLTTTTIQTEPISSKSNRKTLFLKRKKDLKDTLRRTKEAFKIVTLLYEYHPNAIDFSDIKRKVKEWNSSIELLEQQLLVLSFPVDE